MMTDYKQDFMNTTIKLIDVFGQFGDDGTGHCYTYLPSQQEEPSGWKNVIEDLRGEVSDSLHCCYATWCTSTDWWLAKMVRNPHDPKGGLAMLSICLGSNRPLEGKKAITALDKLVQFFILEKHWDDAGAEKVLMNQEQDFVLVPCELRSFDETSPIRDSAYRSYETKEQLGQYLSFLPQSVYGQYIGIFFVPKEEEACVSMKCLDGKFPLKKFYVIQYPENCTSSPLKTEIMDGEDLTLVYSKSGFESKKIRIKGGVDSDYVDIDGTNMRIRSGEEIGLAHDRVIEIVCQDRSGGMVEDFRIVSFAQQVPVKIHGNTVTVSEADLDKDVELEINPIGDRYDSKRIVLDKEKLDGNQFMVELETKQYMVMFNMNNVEFETKSTMSPSVARNKWSGFDFKIDDRNRIITFKAWPKPQEKTQQEVNFFVERKVPWIEYIGNFFKKWWKLMLILLAGILVIYGIYVAIDRLVLNKPKPTPTQTEVVGNTTEVQTDVSSQPENEGVEPQEEFVKPQDEAVKSENVVKPDNESVQHQNEVATAEVKPSGPTTPFVQQDIEYLTRENALWARDSLQSQEYQAFYENIAKGRMDDVIAQYDALFGDKEKTNDTFKKIVEGLIKVRQSGNEPMVKLASDEMKRLSRGSSIKLAELKTSIAIVVKRCGSSKQ